MLKKLPLYEILVEFAISILDVFIFALVIINFVIFIIAVIIVDVDRLVLAILKSAVSEQLQRSVHVNPAFLHLQ